MDTLGGGAGQLAESIGTELRRKRTVKVRSGSRRSLRKRTKMLARSVEAVWA